MADPFVGQVILFAGNFAPRGWAFCDGQLLPISSNTALFSLLGTTYGGDGRTTFALPDLRARVPVGEGPGPGLSTVRWGEKGGGESVTLTQAQLPNHTHDTIPSPVNLTVAGTPTEPATVPSATNNVLGASGPGPGSASIWSTAATDPVTIAAGSVAPVVTHTGGSQPFPIRNPYLGMHYIIALVGIFPSRS
jgi:microcystin-dependent protein